MAGEKKARKMGAADKIEHKKKESTCPHCGGIMVWARLKQVTTKGMAWWCPNENCLESKKNVPISRFAVTMAREGE